MISFYKYANLLLNPLVFAFFLLNSLDLKSQCLEGDCENGTGKYKCDCGYIYEGTFEDGKKKYGVMTKEHLVYTGPFEDDMAHGKGKMVRDDGSVYQGDFAFSTPHGWGTFFLTNGFSYTGEINTGKYHGWGMLIDSNQTPLNAQIAQFNKGEIDGFSIEQNASDTMIVGLKNKGQWEGTAILLDLAEKQIEVNFFKKGKLKKELDRSAVKQSGVFEKTFKKQTVQISFFQIYLTLKLTDEKSGKAIQMDVNAKSPVIRIKPSEGTNYIWQLNTMEFIPLSEIN